MPGPLPKMGTSASHTVLSGQMLQTFAATQRASVQRPKRGLKSSIALTHFFFFFLAGMLVYDQGQGSGPWGTELFKMEGT